MDKDNNRKGIHITVNESQIKLVGIMFLFFLLTSNKKSPSKFNLKEIDDVELAKKCMLLNRIKGYMNPEEQYIVHRAEVILEIIRKVRSLIEGPELHSAEVQYHSLSLEDRKRNMLLDLSKHMEEEYRDIIHTAIDLDIKARNIEKRVRELNRLTQDGITLENVEKIVELIEPLLEGEVRSKTKDIKKITSMLKIIKLMEEKGSIDENDLLEVISPYVNPQQRESLTKMMQIAKAVGSTINNSSNKENEGNREGSKKLDKEEDRKEYNEGANQNHYKVNENEFGDRSKEENT